VGQGSSLECELPRIREPSLDLSLKDLLISRGGQNLQDMSEEENEAPNAPADVRDSNGEQDLSLEIGAGGGFGDASILNANLFPQHTSQQEDEDRDIFDDVGEHVIIC
jgi:hypothetical protein